MRPRLVHLAVHKVANPHIAPEMMTANRTSAVTDANLRSTPPSSKQAKATGR
jgi:hypothetical protein